MRAAVAVAVGVGALAGVGALVWWLRRSSAEGGDVSEVEPAGPFLFNADRAEGVESQKLVDLMAHLRVNGVVFNGRRYAVTVGLDGGVRTDAKQLTLYAKGRQQLPDGSWIVVDPKAVVTNAQTASQSYHGRKKAIDFWILLDGGAPLLFPKNAPGATSAEREAFFAGVYAALGAVIEAHGLVWGGRFKLASGPDRPHAEDRT